MTDEHKLLRDTDKALKASKLLEDEVLVEAFNELEKSYTERLFVTNHDDVTGREKLYLAVNVVRKVRDHLNVVVNNGKLAQAELAMLAKEVERKKRFGII